MRKLVTWLLVTLGIAALVRKLRRRAEPELAAEPPPAEPRPAEPGPAEPAPTEAATEEAPAHEPPAESEGGDPAAELRERLARSRAEMPSASDESLEERRAAVHEEGRSALDEMRPPEESSDAPDEAQ
jgi:hypothetical protein